VGTGNGGGRRKEGKGCEGGGGGEGRYDDKKVVGEGNEEEMEQGNMAMRKV
jgi:hypothetical protein